ncbi:unnamed protein product [Owenia fusiformis]|uniref:Uncharacterized protein n=1 Tax=Owenia fusiformis TaxID=6347 RepID=A0A8J1TAG6_OWEFU|nr:unnamed protein product [Owenia fusiformis]
MASLYVKDDAPAFSDLDQKKTEMTDKLKLREDERLAQIDQRREEKESTEAKDENTKYFTENFRSLKNEIEAKLVECEKIPKTKLGEYFENVSLNISKLQKFLADSTLYLPKYEIRQAQETISKLQNELSEMKEKMVPKKKFAFKSKKKTAAKAPEKPIEVAPAPTVTKVIELNECNFADKNNEELTKSSDELNNKDVSLARLNHCTVKLFGAPSAIHINKLQDCTILCGPVSGSVFIDNCVDCKFVLACQQLRIHHTTKTHFYIHVTSRAIIEDCNTVEFAPYNLEYPNLDSHYEVSGLNKARNSWDDVDDFNWLASDAKSPNWNILDVNKRVTTWK